MDIEVNKVVKRYFRKRGQANYFNAVDDVSLTLDGGALTVLTGDSGSGKTTLMNMMSGLLAPDEGTVTAGGSDLYAMDDRTLSAFRARHFAVIPQGISVLYSLSAKENILLPSGLFDGDKTGRNSDAAAAGERAGELIGRLGIEETASAYPKELSGGELRRVAVARALVKKADAVFADEPTADLDEKSMRCVMELLKEAAQEGAAVLVVTHDRMALSYADVKLSIENGRLTVR